MQFKPTPIPGAFEIQLSPFQDERGVFSRIFCGNEFSGIGHQKPVVQANHSLTREKGSIRGMHFQYPPDAEIKIIRCIRGKVYDVMVDLRSGSPAFLTWHAVILSPDAFNMVYIPEGCAHGFQTLEADSELLYFHTAFYNKDREGGLRFDDPRLGIDWPAPARQVSARDGSYPLLTDAFKGVMNFRS